MDAVRIALANLRFPATPAESVSLAEHAIFQASAERATLICFPECYIPGYRADTKRIPPPDSVFLEHAWSVVAAAAAKTDTTVILGTERVVDGKLFATALVINGNGRTAGFQDKVQMDPSEEGTYSSGSGRKIFQAGPLTFALPFVLRAGAIRKRFAGPPAAARRLCFIRNSTKPNPAGTCLRPSPIR
jgi:predicted amidohydrolase